MTRGGLIEMIVLIFRLLWSQEHELVHPRHIRHGRIGVRSGDHESAAPEQPAIDEGSLTRRDGNRGHDSSDRRTRIDPCVPRRTICCRRCPFR